jgi:hypothetical protein
MSSSKQSANLFPPSGPNISSSMFSGQLSKTDFPEASQCLEEPEKSARGYHFPSGSPFFSIVSLYFFSMFFTPFSPYFLP